MTLILPESKQQTGRKKNLHFGSYREMRNGDNTLVSTGTSFAEFDLSGKLISATGFFEVPGVAAQ